MNIQTVRISIEGLSPLLFNRKSLMLDIKTDANLQKVKAEDGLEYENRIFREKAHVNAEGFVVVPQTWIKRSLVETQRQNACPIKPPSAARKNATMKTQLNAGFFCEDCVVQYKGSGFKKEDLVPYRSICTIPSTGGSIPVVRPMIPAGWTVDIDFQIISPEVTESVLRELMTWVGIFAGIGEWRVSNGGQFGRFKVL